MTKERVLLLLLLFCFLFFPPLSLFVGSCFVLRGVERERELEDRRREEKEGGFCGANPGVELTITWLTSYSHALKIS